jgi:uncharacterized membrane protein YkvI
MCSMSPRTLIVVSLAFVMAIGALAAWLANAFDASGAVGAIVFVLAVSIAGLVGGRVSARLPRSHPPR